jgi:hypothetical protein
VRDREQDEQLASLRAQHLRATVGSIRARVEGSLRHWFSAGSCAVVLIAAWNAGCQGSIGDEPDCCPAPVECPPDAVEVQSCTTADCFTVEEGCCSPVQCVPASSCTMQCLFEETPVSSCENLMEHPFNCRTFESCGRVVHCMSEALCGARPVCDVGDEELFRGYCPVGSTCYSVELCNNIILCLLTGAEGGGGSGGAGGSGGGGGR